MKPFIFILALFALVILSCNSENRKKITSDSPAKVIAVDTTFTSANPKKSSTCYAYTGKGDTASLKLDIDGDELTGELNYKLFEKDNNKGKIAGELRGDTIVAEYIFDSEGMRSVREVVFVKKDDGKIYEGTGEVIEKNGKMMFKDRSALKFGQGIVFTKIDCK